METHAAQPKRVSRSKQQAGATKRRGGWPKGKPRKQQPAAVPAKVQTITGQTYQTLDEAYGFFNTALFGGQLPGCLITLNRHANSKGYFRPESFGSRTGVGFAHEMALNPDTFAERSDTEIISTMVHEMCHCWQEAFGTPPRKGYHDKEWAEKMKDIGLQPSDTGEVGGKETGQGVSHYIPESGPFVEAATRWQHAGYVLLWQSVNREPLPAPPGTNGTTPKSPRATKAASKTKYTCPACALNAWAKPEVSLVCGACALEMDMQ